MKEPNHIDISFWNKEPHSAINTITKVRKTVAAAKEIDKERSIKLTFSGIVNRNYAKQIKEIATVNSTLH